MPLTIKDIEKIASQVSRVTMEGKPVSSKEELPVSVILQIYKDRENFESRVYG
jgi:hypothetical protein